MSNIQSYNALIDRFKAFASGHYILKAFSHGQINEADLAKFSLYPFMHVVPADVTYDRGTKTFSFQIILADLPRDKEDKTEYQKEVLSDLQRIAEDLIAEITNHRMLFGELITCQNVSIQPFLEEFHHTLTGWTVSIDLLVPYYWDACSIPAEWNDMFESSTGGTGTILSFEDSIVRDENGIVTLVNDEANPAPNYYYGTNSEGVRGWYLITDEVGLTCQTIGSCQTIIDIESEIDLLQTDVTNLQTDVALKANISDISAVGFSNDYNDLDNLPTIPAGGLPAGGTAGQILTKVDSTDYNATWQENFADWTSVVKHTVKNNGTQTLDKGKAVYITTSNGTNMLVGYASNNTEATSSKTIGLLQSTLTTTGTNSTGFVITEGLLGGLNTQGTTAGDPIWLGVDGNLIYGLANKPYAPAHLVFIGIVTKVSAGNGEIFVKVQNGFELKEIHDVDLVTTTPVNGNVLGFDGTLWVNKTIAGWLGFTPVTNARTLTINGTAYDLSADRSWTIASNPGTVTSVSALTIGTTGTDLSSTVANSTTTPVITLNVPTASATNRGALSSTDWSTFNGKFTLPSLTSGSVLFSNGTTIAQNNSQLFWDATNNRFNIGTNLGAYGKGWIQSDVSSVTDYTLVLNNRNTAGAGGESTGIYFANSGYGAANAPYDTRHIVGSIKALATNFNNTTSWGVLTFNLNNSSAVQEEVMRLVNTTKNVLIGTTTDAGYKLDVNGTARVQNTLNVNAVGDSISVNSGAFVLQSTSGIVNYRGTSPNSSGSSHNFTHVSSFTNTSGDYNLTRLIHTFNPTSGTATNSSLLIVPTINQTGGANGITRGLYINPTLTAAADFRAIETTNGKVIFGGTGNVLIGTTTDAGFKLDVNGTARVSGALTCGTINSGGTTNVSGMVVYQGTIDPSSGYDIRLVVPTATKGVVVSHDYSFSNASAILQANSTTQGFLPPRMTTTQKNAIASPAAGLMVYDTTLALMSVYNGTTWITL